MINTEEFKAGLIVGAGLVVFGGLLGYLTAHIVVIVFRLAGWLK